VEAYNEASTQRVKEFAGLLNGQALQIISGVGGMFDKHSKFLTLEKLYPNLFKKSLNTKNMTQEQAETAAYSAWKAFLRKAFLGV